MPGANECTAQIVLIHRSWDKGSRENNQCPDFHYYPRVLQSTYTEENHPWILR